MTDTLKDYLEYIEKIKQGGKADIFDNLILYFRAVKNEKEGLFKKIEEIAQREQQDYLNLLGKLHKELQNIDNNLPPFKTEWYKKKFSMWRSMLRYTPDAWFTNPFFPQLYEIEKFHDKVIRKLQILTDSDSTSFVGMVRDQKSWKNRLKLIKSYKDYEDHFYELLRFIDEKLLKEVWGDYLIIESAIARYQTMGGKSSEDLYYYFIAIFQNLVFSIVKMTGREVISVSQELNIKGLFTITEHPPLQIRYDGQNKKIPRRWILTRNRTQVYAILHLAYDKYRRQQFKGETITRIVLSFAEIKECLDDSSKCVTPPNWQTIRTDKNRLEDLKDNIRGKIPFGEDELFVETRDSKPFLVFQILR